MMGVKKRSGIAIHLVMATLLTLLSIGSAFVLSRTRSLAKIPVEAKIMADYEMESALVMQYQKIKYGNGISSDTFIIPSHIIAPGINLEVITNKVSSDLYQIKAQVTGIDFYKSISAKVILVPDSKLSKKWKMLYIKGG